MRIAHISDLHVGKTASEWPAMRRLLADLRSDPWDVLVVSGDVVDVPDDAQALADVHQALEELGRPYVVVPGNHDVQTPGENKTFERFFGEFPRAERVAGATFLLFDSFGDLPVSRRSEEDHTCFANTGCWLDGYVSGGQLGYVGAQLRHDDGPRIAVVHHHLDPSPDEQVNALLNAEEFCDWCVAHRVAHVFVGHLHRTVPAAEVHGVMRLRIGRSTKAPFPIGLLDSETGEYSIHDLGSE